MLVSTTQTRLLYQDEHMVVVYPPFSSVDQDQAIVSREAALHVHHHKFVTPFRSWLAGVLPSHIIDTMIPERHRIRTMFGHAM